jgi:hypothetical protein
VVNGSLIAAEHLRKRGGGAIINTGSILSDRTMIYQTQYSATKHAVKAFTDGLRMELEAEGAPISVTLIKPSSIDTPYPEHARNYLDAPGLTLPPPAYDPAVVARAILFAAENPKRSLTVGFGGYAIALFGAHFPGLTDRLMELGGYASQTTDEPGARDSERRDNLYRPREDGDEHSSLGVHSRKSSLFLEAQMRPATTAAVLAGLGLALGLALRGRGGTRQDRRQGLMPVRGRTTGRPPAQKSKREGATFFGPGWPATSRIATSTSSGPRPRAIDQRAAWPGGSSTSPGFRLVCADDRDSTSARPVRLPGDVREHRPNAGHPRPKTAAAAGRAGRPDDAGKGALRA